MNVPRRDCERPASSERGCRQRSEAEGKRDSDHDRDSDVASDFNFCHQFAQVPTYISAGKSVLINPVLGFHARAADSGAIYHGRLYRSALSLRGICLDLLRQQHQRCLSTTKQCNGRSIAHASQQAESSTLVWLSWREFGWLNPASSLECRVHVAMTDRRTVRHRLSGPQPSSPRTPLS